MLSPLRALKCNFPVCSGVGKQDIMLKWVLLCSDAAEAQKQKKKGVGGKSPYFKVGFETTFMDRQRRR